MGWLKFRGVSTGSLANVYVSRMPDHKKAAMRHEEYYVKGRDGALHVDEGYEDIELESVLVLVNAGAESRLTVNAWADGTGKLITSDDPTRAYQASVKDGISWNRVKAASAVPAFSADKSYSIGDICQYGGNVYRFTAAHSGAWSSGDAVLIPVPNGFFDTASVKWVCQPFMVEAVDSQVTLTATGSIANPGSATALPLITVSGSGDASFSINGNEIEIDDMTANVPVNIDCATGYVYTASGATAIRGEIPVLALGTNTITFGSNVTSITITPRWRWV